MTRQDWGWLALATAGALGVGLGAYYLSRPRPRATTPSETAAASTAPSPTASAAGTSATAAAASSESSSVARPRILAVSIQAVPTLPALGQSVRLTALAVFDGPPPPGATVQIVTTTGQAVPPTQTLTAQNGVGVVATVVQTQPGSQTYQAVLQVAGQTRRSAPITVTWQAPAQVQQTLFQPASTSIYYQEAIHGQITPSSLASAAQQAQYAQQYAQLGILPSLTGIGAGEQQAEAIGVKRLLAAGASNAEIENYLIQNFGFSPQVAATEAAQAYPLTYFAGGSA